MTRTVWFRIFLTVVVAVLATISFLTALFAGVCFDLRPQTINGVAFGLWVASLLYILGEFVSRKAGRFWLKTIGAIVLGAMSINVAVMAIGTVALMAGAPKQAVGWAWIGGVYVLSIWALIMAAATPRVRHVHLKLSPDKPLQAPLKIVQLTDIHLNGLKSVSWVKALVDRVNALNPDIIIFTGDLFDVSPRHLQPHFDQLKRLDAKLGKLAVSGNHDFYVDYMTYQEVIDLIGFDLIDNRLITLRGVQFAGLPDQDGKRFGHSKERISEILGPRDPQKPMVVLDHRPDDFEAAVDAGADIQFSGHTHWGQLPPWGLLVRLRYRYHSGLQRYKSGQLYTSKGTGTWGPPMRLFRPSEVVVATITV